MSARRCWTAIAVGSALVLAPAAAVAANDPEPVPAEYTDPSPELVAASIHVWDPTGHVEAMETQTTEGTESVLSLDSDILFAFGSAELSPTAVTRIEALVGDIPQGAAVTVTGHTDDVGTDADNLVLSQQRAEAVAAAIAGARADLVLDVAGRGESEPVASNMDDAGREANRRVEVRYLT